MYAVRYNLVLLLFRDIMCMFVPIVERSISNVISFISQVCISTQNLVCKLCLQFQKTELFLSIVPNEAFFRDMSAKGNEVFVAEGAKCDISCH